MAQVQVPTARRAVRLVVLDWDDTCCPSSWIASTPEHEYDDAANLAMLRCVEEGVSTLLRTVESVGCSVVIITNADEAWVQFSAKRFLPRIVGLLARVRVVSARHYEGLYPGRSVCWKAAAFTHVAKAFFAAQSVPEDSVPREIISIGDSNDERLAVRAAAAPLDSIAKAIKLVDAPTLDTVAAQLRTVATCLSFLVMAEHAVDVDIAAILNYMNLGNNSPSDEAAAAAQNQHPQTGDTGEQSLWHEAAWGILTAIRFQSLNHQQQGQDETLQPPPLLRAESNAVASVA